MQVSLLKTFNVQRRLAIFESLLRVVGESNGKNWDSTDLYLIFGTSKRDEGLVFCKENKKKRGKRKGDTHT